LKILRGELLGVATQWGKNKEAQAEGDIDKKEKGRRGAVQKKNGMRGIGY